VRALLAALLAALAAGAAWAQNTNDPRVPSGPMPRGAQDKSDWEIEQERRQETGGEAAPPAWPKDANLVEFNGGNVTTFRFFIDSASLTVASGVVRYALVARSPSGVSNYSYEGMRCEGAGQVRIYAYGQDGRWVAQRSEWREIQPKVVQSWHQELRSRYFCPNRIPVASAAEGLDALRRGGHPSVDAGMRLGR
jgi:hypothetical protein